MFLFIAWLAVMYFLIGKIYHEWWMLDQIKRCKEDRRHASIVHCVNSDDVEDQKRLWWFEFFDLLLWPAAIFMEISGSRSRN